MRMCDTKNLAPFSHRPTANRLVIKDFSNHCNLIVSFLRSTSLTLVLR